MFPSRIFIGLFCLLVTYEVSEAQIRINEISNKNSGQIFDEDNDLEDWIEIFNSGDSACNLNTYSLSDDSVQLGKWKFPSREINPGEFLVVFASGKNRFPGNNFSWVSAVLPEHNFTYIVPSELTPEVWNQPDFIPEGWNTGRAGFGYGDGDDSTIVPQGVLSVYVLDTFMINESFKFEDAILHVDYDDGFVAWLNGIEIARSNIDGVPTWNSQAASNHEALQYSGGFPERFNLDTILIKSALITGKNVFAIEVHNIDNSSSDLTLIPYLSFLISDTVSDFQKSPDWLLPSNANILHTNFKINGTGEIIYLSDSVSGQTEFIDVKNLDPGWSIGRVTDGIDSLGIFIQPTPGSPNLTKAYSSYRESEPSFSVTEGFYTSIQNIILSSGSPAEIRYTLDGSIPDINSTLFDGTPILVSENTVLRAGCFSRGDTLPGRSVVNSYFINTNHNVPVISVITNNENLYGDSGIFDHWDQEWERSCYVEYFDTTHHKIFEQFSGIQIDGGAGGSRSQAQHSFRLEFSNSLYGEEDIVYKLIGNRPERDDYKSVYLRNGSNQWLTFQFKDAMECKLTSFNTHNYYSSCEPVAVYLNGKYFGLYEMREKLNDEYFEKNYGATIDSSFHLLSLSYYYGSVLRANNGSVDSFNIDYNNFVKLDTSSPQFLENADKIIDLDYYTDYIIAQSWIGNTDWPYNNIKIVKGDFSGHRWRFILQDLEWALNPNGWTDYTINAFNYLKSYESNRYLVFWFKLMENPTYKRNFINRYADILNSAYLPENTQKTADEIYQSSFLEMRNEYVRWAGGESAANSRMIEYANNLEIFKNELNLRNNMVRTQISSNFNLPTKYTIELQILPANTGYIQVNTISPLEYPWKGIYFSSVPISIEAKGVGNYVFDEWEPNAAISDITNPKLLVDIKNPGYKFYAKFKKQLPEQAITISEINYNSTDIFRSTDWVELYNFGNTLVNLNGWYITDDNPDHKWVIPGTFILNPGERIVLCSDINKFNKAYPLIQNVVGSFVFGLSSTSDKVFLYNNEDKVISEVCYESAYPWPSEPLNQGTTLELIDPYNMLSTPSNWFSGCIGGSPGKEFVRCDLSINESKPDFEISTTYPNPVNDEINIVLSSDNLVEKLQFRIYDIMGNLVYYETNHIPLNNVVTLSVHNLTPGIYIIKISDNKSYQTYKFVKAN